MVIDLSKDNSVLSQYMADMRNVDVQTDSLRFRANLERVGKIIGYEISKKLEYRTSEVTTPLGTSPAQTIASQPVVATILRAGLPLHNGILEMLDKSENAFISAYRQHHKDGTFEVHVDYLASPSIEGKDLILCDPMLATGTSMVLAYKAMLLKGKPRHVHIVAVIASTLGVEYVRKNMPDNTTIWCCGIDEELTAQSYIVPGLGDAGDLAFGEKL